MSKQFAYEICSLSVATASVKYAVNAKYLSKHSFVGHSDLFSLFSRPLAQHFNYGSFICSCEHKCCAPFEQPHQIKPTSVEHCQKEKDSNNM